MMNKDNSRIEADGFSFPKSLSRVMPAKDIELQLKWIKEMEIRPDDVIICAFPKTGTHWTWEVVNMIQRGITEYHPANKGNFELEFCTKEMMSSLSSPRVLNTHLSHTLLPSGIQATKCKIIHVLRNPKDVAVSAYFYTKEIARLWKMPGDSKTFREYAESFRTTITFYCPYLWYIKQWEQFQNDNPDYPLLHVFYEDMIQEPEKQIEKIAAFLGKKLDDTIIRVISEKCQFENLKEAHASKSVPKTVSKPTKGIMYRKGRIGDWKNYFNVAESEAYDKWIEEEMKDSKIKFKYE